MKISEKCKGCNSHGSFIKCMDYVIADNCPCQTCLIKMVCTQACDEFKKVEKDKRI